MVLKRMHSAIAQLPWVVFLRGYEKSWQIYYMYIIQWKFREWIDTMRVMIYKIPIWIFLMR